MLKTFWQMVRYGIVGATATAFDYAAYFFFTRALGWSVGWANPVAYCIGNVVSFLGHRSITFRSSGAVTAEYGKFIVVTVLGLGLSQLVVVGLVALSVNDLIAKAASVLVSGLFNYLLNRFWTFRKLPKTA